MPETPDELAERLADIAVQLVDRVRDDDPKVVGQWLAGELQDPADWFRIAFVLAAAVPVDRTWSELIAWAHPDPSKRLGPPKVRSTCNSPAGASAHRRHREQLCPPCRESENAQKSVGREIRRARQAA